MDRNYEDIKEIKRIRWLLFGVMSFIFACEVVIQAISSFMSKPPDNFVRMTIVEVVSFSLVLYLYGRLVKGKLNAKKDLSLNPVPLKNLIYPVILGISGQFVIMILNLPLQFLNQLIFPVNGVIESESFSILKFIAGVIAAGLIPAFFEELMFRGIVFKAYNNLSTKLAVIFTTFVFVIFHGKPECIFGYIFMSLMTVYIMRRCNSLYGAIIYHLFSNIAALLFGMIAVDIVSVLWIIFIVMIFIFVAALIRFHIKFPPVRATKSRKDTNLLIGSVISLPMLLSYGIVILRYWLLNFR